MTRQAGRGYLARQFGEAIVAKRTAEGKSQRAYAREHGMAPNTLREVELGLANPTLGRVEQLAEDLDLDLGITEADRTTTT